MGSFSIENQGVNTYLVYKISEQDEMDSLSLGMITNNKIKGLAQVLFTQMDENKYLKYNITSRISLKQYFSRDVNKKRLLGVFSSIVNAMVLAEEYMVDLSTLILDIDYIYVDVATSDAILVCLPVTRENNDTNEVLSFFKNILFSTQFDQTENFEYFAKIINYLNSTSVFSLTKFKELLDRLSLESPQPAVNSSGTTKKTPVVAETDPFAKVKTDVHVPVVNQPQKKVGGKAEVAEAIKKVEELVGSKKNNASGVVTPVVEKTEPEKKMSILYLLQHFSKENLELYKAQKNQNNVAGNSVKAPKAEKKADKPKKQSGKQVAVDFQIPGQAPAFPAAKKEAEQVVEQTPKFTPAQMVTPPAPPAKTEIKADNKIDFGDTLVLDCYSGTEGTIVLDSYFDEEEKPKPIPYLIRSKNNQKIEINKARFSIGSEQSYVDYFIHDNMAISHSHADIVVTDDACYVIDMNSTNHTFVNGQMIPSGKEILLENGATLRLANENFEFKYF